MHNEIIKMFDLSGKVALVVGGAANLGFDMAGVLAGANADVAITSRELAKASKSAEALKAKYGMDILPCCLDHTNIQQIQNVIKTVHAWKGHIDILVNNAGGGSGIGICDFLKRPPEAMSQLITMNLLGPLYCCQEVGKIMVAQGYGKIINIASVAGLKGRDRRMYARHNLKGQPIDYAAAKAGVIGMSQDLAAYLSPKGIHVNCISPGGFNRNLPDGFVKEYSDRTPLGRMGQDGLDLKGAVLFLASSASDYITGHNLVVDGGFTIWQ
jgi:NAD(P)-dependent dehydrogenase (short-subunit alcohol dehydrogenase family)